MMVQQRFRPILHHLIMLLSYEKRMNLDIVCGISKQIAADRYIYLYLSYASSLTMSWLKKQVGGLFRSLVDVSRHN